MKSSHAPSRRHVLRGVGVTLGLPFLESLAPRSAAAQAEAKKRWVVMFFPNGTPNFNNWWKPTGQGAGSAWKLSALLDPLAKVKAKTTVMTNVENYSPFGSFGTEPSHSQLAGAFLTCNRCAPSPSELRNAMSADQMLAKTWAGKTPFASLQVGLTTRYGDPDGRHPANSRSISWASPTEPLYKVVNPQTVFDSLVASAPTNGSDPAATKRRALRKSALDYVLESATDLQKKVGTTDKARIDQYLTSVRDLEKRVAGVTTSMPGAGGSCQVGERPPFAAGVGIAPSGYTRDKHADVMVDLTVMALQCDLTRVITFMLDDERSEYAYTFLPLRSWSNTGSTLAGGNTLGTYHDLQHSGDTNNGFATITNWNVQKLARLCEKLDAITEGGGKTILDNSVVYFGSSMHGGNHSGKLIPSLYVGSGGGVLKTDQHIVFPGDQRLSDIYLTFMQKAFGMSVTQFGNSAGVLNALLA